MIALLAQATTDVDFALPANIAFGITAAVMLFAAFRVVTTENIMHAALYLVVVLSGVAVNYILLQAEFVAVTQVLVYIGAIIVLFLFGIMLTHAPLGRSDDLDNDKLKPIGIGTGLLMAVVMAYALISTFGDDEIAFGTENSIEAVSDSIFSDYVLPFEIVSVLLLSALIGAIVLARKD